jgi:hypothetical protein
MEFLGKPLQSNVSRSLVAALLLAVISGCASPGPARPPSLHLPRVVTDLSAARTGDNVTLHWTTPDETTDGLKIQIPITAEICREVSSSLCTSIKRPTVHPGPTEASETLPLPLTTGPTTLLTYRIRLLNVNGHSAGLSAPAFAAAGAAPPPVQGLHATPIREGAMLEWQTQPTQSTIELDRILVQTAAPPKRSSAKSLQLNPATTTEIHLRAGQPSADPGGTIDPTAQRGETYRYTAQRVRSVKLSIHTLELRSTPSAAITVVMRDTFPPKAPIGLAAVPSADAIDLSWEPNTESDLAGYIVYRQQTSSSGATVGTPTRLNPAPIPGPAFSDHTAQSGQTYAYRVTAIDTAGNESPASNEAHESLRSQ